MFRDSWVWRPWFLNVVKALPSQTLFSALGSALLNFIQILRGGSQKVVLVLGGVTWAGVVGSLERGVYNVLDGIT